MFLKHFVSRSRAVKYEPENTTRRVEIFRAKGEAGTLLPVSRTGQPLLIKHQEFDSVKGKYIIEDTIQSKIIDIKMSMAYKEKFRMFAIGTNYDG